MKRRSKWLSMVVANTAVRIVAFKAAKMGDSARAGQFAASTREVAEAGSSIDEEVLEDLGRNADLYIFSQD